ncbi:hypothetical protein J6590_103034, partial [Homalodisca vitripennis]
TDSHKDIQAGRHTGRQHAHAYTNTRARSHPEGPKVNISLERNSSSNLQVVYSRQNGSRDKLTYRTRVEEWLMNVSGLYKHISHPQ